MDNGGRTILLQVVRPSVFSRGATRRWCERSRRRHGVVARSRKDACLSRQPRRGQHWTAVVQLLDDVARESFEDRAIDGRTEGLPGDRRGPPGRTKGWPRTRGGWRGVVSRWCHAAPRRGLAVAERFPRRDPGQRPVTAGHGSPKATPRPPLLVARTQDVRCRTLRPRVDRTPRPPQGVAPG